jgi:hypothetical protein
VHQVSFVFGTIEIDRQYLSLDSPGAPNKPPPVGAGAGVVEPNKPPVFGAGAGVPKSPPPAGAGAKD